MRVKIVSYERPGLVVRARWRRQFTIAYGEILTAERLGSRLGLRLHTRTTKPVRIAGRGDRRASIENELRARGVRIVDEFGAIIAPSLADFEAEMARGPSDVRQSSDNA